MSAPSNASSETVTSEEDSKLNIPLSFEEIQEGSLTIRSCESKSHDNTTFENVDTDNANPSNFNCELWNNSEGFIDENLPNLNATEYDATTVMEALVDDVEKKSCELETANMSLNSFQTEMNSSSLFKQNNSMPDVDNAATISSGTHPASNRLPTPNMYNDSVVVEEDIKYSPDEIMLQSPSTFQYNYNSTLLPTSSHRTPPYGHPLSPMHHVMDPPNFPRPHLQPPQTHAQPLYGQFAHPSGYHPNMWYPNAPYGSATGYCRPYGGNRYPNYGTYPNDPMLDMLQLSNSGREARNRAEKNRRDKLNGSIQELSTMVPHVAESPRRVDKTAVLRFAAHGLRLQYIFGGSNNNSHSEYTDSLMKMLDRFFIALTCHGQIVLISSSVEKHLGHCQTDLYGQNILNITHPEDHNVMKQQLIPSDLDELLGLTVDDDDSSEARTRTPEQEEYIDRRLRSDRRSFTVRLARAGPRSEPTAYEIVRIEGNFRRSDAAPRGAKVNTHPSNIHMIRRSRGRDDTMPFHAISGNDIVLIATARIIRPPKFVNSICNSLEYRTRHLIDGRILECDQKIGLVAGYMAGEVRGTSPFTFIHDDDMPYVIVALRQMYDDGRTTGESTYRLSTNTGQYIYLRSKGFLDVDETNNVVHSFLCVNTLLDEEEGKRKLAQMRRDYGPRVSKEFPHLALKSPDAHDPQELENAVFRLVENLQKPSAEYDEDDGDSSTESYSSEYVPPSEEEIRRCSAHFFKNSYSTVHAAGYRFGKSSKTPPLALVPPEACSIRTSINRSINVVNTTAVKNLSNEQINTSNAVNCQPATNQHASPVEIDGLTTSSESCLCQGKSTDYCNYCLKLNSQSSHSLSNKRSGESMDSQELKLPKRRLKSAEIEHVLSDSLDQLGRTLDKQLSAAKELRDKSTKYEVPNSNQRLDELMEEHQMQSQIYVDIKSEYEVQKQNNSIDTNTTMHTMHGNQRQQQQFSADENDN